MDRRRGEESLGKGCLLNAYYNENEPFAAAWLRGLIDQGLIAPGYVDERDIRDVKPADLTGYTQCHLFAGIGGWSYALRLAGWPDDRPVWTGSCPCQPFSNAGKGEGFNDTRHLWPTWFRLIQQCKPSTVFGEQVASKDGLAWFDHVSTDLEAEDYAVGAADMPAAGVGAPHIRQRLWWLANANDTGWQGTVWQGQQDTPRHSRETSHSEPVRPACGHWPAGPDQVHKIPLLSNGLPGTVGACKGYGNAIVPQVAAEFIGAYLDVVAE